MVSETWKIYEALRDKIIWLELLPESVLNIDEICKAIGVSRPLIRETLSLLQAEGWVQRHGSRFVVTPLSLARFSEIKEMRLISEVRANVLAMERLTSEEAEILKEISEEVQRTVEHSSRKEIVELDLKFHTTLYRATKNNALAQHLEWLMRHFVRFVLSSYPEFRFSAQFGQSTLDKVDIIQAVLDRDEARLIDLSTRHIESAVDQIRRSL